jgi:hypothetical protein
MGRSKARGASGQKSAASVGRKALDCLRFDARRLMAVDATVNDFFQRLPEGFEDFAIVAAPARRAAAPVATVAEPGISSPGRLCHHPRPRLGSGQHGGDMAYDAREAKRLLSDHLEKHEPDVEGAARAWERLLADFASTCAELKLSATAIEPDRLRVTRPKGGVVALAYRKDARFVVKAEGEHFKGEERPLKLRFNRLSGQLEGLSEDTAIIPTPGELRPRRSAMAVLAAAVARALSVHDETGAGDRIGFSPRR